MGGDNDTAPPSPSLHFRRRKATDCFNEAHYCRLERLLNADARLACSAWSFVAPDVQAGYVHHLRSDIEDGRWDARHGALRRQAEFDGSLRLVVAIT